MRKINYTEAHMKELEYYFDSNKEGTELSWKLDFLEEWMTETNS